MAWTRPGHTGRPARPGRLVLAAALVVTSSWRGGRAGWSAGREPRHTRGRGRVGFGTCCGTATCVPGRARGARPGGKRSHNSAPGCGPTSGVAHSTLAGRTRAAAKKFLLRDHARAQLQLWWELAAKRRHADGAHVLLGHAGLWLPGPGVVGPAGGRPASGAVGGGSRGLGSNVGSSGVAGTGGHSLCADRSAAAVVVAFSGGRAWYYYESSPRERRSPKG
jgi:hypothetical protein